MKILVTGANGFVGKNLVVKLNENGYRDIVSFSRDNDISELSGLVSDVDFVFHLAGVNRPEHEIEFAEGNTDFTQTLVEALEEAGRDIPIVFSSSIQAIGDSPYGKSKAAAEKLILDYSNVSGALAYVYQLPNVFGKWCKPNYNSVIATFCHNIAHDLPISVHDENAALSLVYIDDVCDEFIQLLSLRQSSGYKEISVVYKTTVGAVVKLFDKFKNSRETLITEEVGTGLTRALYSTFLSYYSKDQFSYLVPGHSDPRGTFVEMLKTPTAGQFSFFTAHSGVTRGGHYHHSKNEKFLVINGKAKYRFKHILSGETYELVTDASEYRVVETVPGWTHDITNIGEQKLIVMLWANEIFDRSKPDTVASLIE